MKNSDFVPTHIKNFLTDDEVTFFKKTINDYFKKENKYELFNIHQNGMHQLEPGPCEMSNIMSKKISSFFNRQVDNPGFFFARYTNEEGNNPVLHPHMDNYNPGANHSLTLTYILDYSIDWDIYIRDIKYKIDKNDMLIFSGSTHAHWRPQIIFGDKDFYDIIVMQFSFEDSEFDPIPENYLDLMSIERNKYWEVWNDSKQS